MICIPRLGLPQGPNRPSAVQVLTPITDSGKEGTYQVLAHHISSMQEQQFDDFVAVEPHSIVQGTVPFLETV